MRLNHAYPVKTQQTPSPYYDPFLINYINKVSYPKHNWFDDKVNSGKPCLKLSWHPDFLLLLHMFLILNKLLDSSAMFLAKHATCCSIFQCHIPGMPTQHNTHSLIIPWLSATSPFYNVAISCDSLRTSWHVQHHIILLWKISSMSPYNPYMATQ